LKAIYGIAVNQLYVIFSSKYLRYFLFVIAVLVFIFLSGISSKNLENGFIISIWGNEIHNFDSIFLKIYLSLIYLVLFLIIFPLGFAHHIYNLITTDYANIYLSRSISRSDLLIGTLFAFYKFYLILTFSIVFITTIYFFIITGTVIVSLLTTSLQFILLFFSSFTLMSLFIIGTNSIGIATLLYVIYIFFISGLFVIKTSNIFLLNVLNLFSFLLPPISQTYENFEADKTINVIKSLTSLIFLFCISVLIYRRKEFYK